jgi:enoyl-CoA hydratase/carnithine racemase
MSDHLSTVERDGILEVTLNRPEKRNAISDEMWDEMRKAVHTFGSRRELRVMLIGARGAFFSAGSDLNPNTVPDFRGSTLDGRNWFRNKWHTLFDELESIEKPIVAAHQGPCLGSALEMSLSCDFRLAARSARYGLPEIGFGALPGSGGISRLTRVAGPHWTRWLVMAGEQVSADEAVTMGIIHAVYPDEEFASRVRAFCARLAALPYEALGLAKLAIDLTTDLDRTQARAMEGIANSILFTGEEQKELFKAMLARLAAKRRPHGSGNEGSGEEPGA